MANNTLDLLQSLLVGNVMTSAELDQLLRDRVSEDLFLDYKHGNLLNNRREAAQTLRQYMSGFANSAGGVLIVGVDEDSWSVTGCVAPGGGDLAEWASTCLTRIAHRFSPPPRFYTVPHPQGSVLVCAVDRSPGLIPCGGPGGITYYLRVHQQMLPAPEYLASDLLLGKRKHSYVGMGRARVDVSIVPIDEQDRYGKNLSLAFACEVENQGLVPAEGVALGLICWCQSPYERANRHLLSYVDVRTLPVDNSAEIYHVRHATTISPRRRPIVIDTFSLADLSMSGFPVPLVVKNVWYRYVWKAAVYIMTADASPIWYQLSLTINPDLVAQARTQHNFWASRGGFVQTEQLSGQRPVVGWERLEQVGGP